MGTHVVLEGRLTFANAKAAKAACATLADKCGMDPMLGDSFEVVGSSVDVAFNDFVGADTYETASWALAAVATAAIAGSVKIAADGGVVHVTAKGKPTPTPKPVKRAAKKPAKKQPKKPVKKRR